MFSHDEKLKALSLYIKNGLRAAPTVRALGYPSRKMLRRWYLVYASTGGVPIRKPRRPKFSEDQRNAAVDHYLEHGSCLAFTVRELGYPSRETLRQWVYERRPQACTASIQRRDSGPFSEEQKRQAVIELCTREGSAAQVAERVGVSRAWLYAWRHQLLEEEGPTVKKHHKDERAADERAALEQEIKDLQQRVHELQLQHDILVKANELLQKDRGINPSDLTNHEKTLLIDALRAGYRVTELREALSLPRSSYFYHRTRLQRPDRYQQARGEVSRIFEENRRVYGYRRIHSMLGRIGTVISEKVVRRIMSEEQLLVISKRRRRYSAYVGEVTPAVANLVQRNFHADAPSKKWLTDITEFQIPAGKVYLSPMIDCFDGIVVSWSIGTTPDSELVNNMLDLAIGTLGPDEHPIVHSDRGSHYRWPGWIERMATAGLIRSMSKKACTADNAASEGFFGRLKNEMFYNRSWHGVTTERFIELVDQYIRWYNEKRIKLSLGGLSPVEYRARHGLAA